MLHSWQADNKKTNVEQKQHKEKEQKQRSNKYNTKKQMHAWEKNDTILLKL